MEGEQKVKVKYNKELLEECLARDGATLVGEYEKLTCKTIIGFICKCGVEYKKGFDTINNNSGLFCKNCSINKGHDKRNSTINNNLNYKVTLQYLYPDIAKQWHPTKNDELKPENVSPGCNKKVWWLCDKTCPEGCLHEWESVISSRTGRNCGCPYCSIPSKKMCVHNSLEYLYPEIAKQWHPTKNGELKPCQFSIGSGQKVWWLCDKTCPEGCLHEWEATIDKSCGNGKRECPYCAKPIKQFCRHLSIINTHTEISKQWHPTKNGDLNPEDFTVSSGKKVWWLCDKTCPEGCLHEWESTIAHRTNNICPTNCPYCSIPRKQFCKHLSLKYTHSHILKLWHPTKNGDLNPEDFTYGSNNLINWICERGHEWNATIKGVGCIYCKNKTEGKLKSYLTTHFPDLICQYKSDWCKNKYTNRNLPYDFYIPSINCIVELDGGQHFKEVKMWGNDPIMNTKRDVFKMLRAKENGIPNFIRILQEDVYNCSEEWLDTHLLTSLVPDAGVVFIHDEKHGDIYDEHYNLYMKGVIPDITDIGESDEGEDSED